MTDLDLDGFEPVVRVTDESEPTLTVYRGRARLNSSAFTALNKPRRVRVLVNQKRRQMLLQSAATSEPSTYSVTGERMHQFSCAMLHRLLFRDGHKMLAFPLTVTDYGLLLTYTEAEGEDK